MKVGDIVVLLDNERDNFGRISWASRGWIGTVTQLGDSIFTLRFNPGVADIRSKFNPNPYWLPHGTFGLNRPYKVIGHEAR